jgi:TRAP-type C4-dicarboxylate transport system substrate-binding protein
MEESFMNRIRSLGALIAASALISGCGESDDADKAGGEGESDSVVLTLANPDDAAFNLDEYAREVSNASDGSLRIEFRDRWRHGEADNEQGTIEDVRDGKTDMGSVGARAFDLAGITDFQPLAAPFAIDSYALEREVLDSPVAEDMLASVEQLDLVGVTLLPGEMRRPFGISRPLVTAADYRGTTIGVRPSELGAATFDALGATAKGYHFSDDISSFDGIETAANAIAYDYTGPARTFAANVSLWPRVLTIIMNRDSYEALSDDQRQALRDAGSAALDPSLEEVQHREQEAVGILCTRGEIAVRAASASQLESLRSATAPVVKAVERAPETRDAALKIAAMRAEVEPEPPPACTEDGTPASTGGPTPVDGLWLMETTKEEAATVVQPSDLIPENWGEFTFAFREGRFAFTTESPGACIWAYGSYSVDGDVVEWRIEDGGGETPQDAANTPGEVFHYTWSKYRDQLELGPVEGKVSAEPFRVEPWRQLEDEVSLDPLSERCPPPADALEP